MLWLAFALSCSISPSLTLSICHRPPVVLLTDPVSCPPGAWLELYSLWAVPLVLQGFGNHIFVVYCLVERSIDGILLSELLLPFERNGACSLWPFPACCPVSGSPHTTSSILVTRVQFQIVSYPALPLPESSESIPRMAHSWIPDDILCSLPTVPFPIRGSCVC